MQLRLYPWFVQRHSKSIETVLSRPSDVEQLLNERELARLFHVSVGTLRYWRAEGRGPRFRKIGQLVRYAPSDVSEWLRSRPSGGDPAPEERL
jgi:predicted DNA-binding transcriptional regulator AlpA